MHRERQISEWQTSTKPAVYDCILLDESNQSITSPCTQQYLKEPHLTMMCNCAYSLFEFVVELFEFIFLSCVVRAVNYTVYMECTLRLKVWLQYWSLNVTHGPAAITYSQMRLPALGCITLIGILSITYCVTFNWSTINLKNPGE